MAPRPVVPRPGETHWRQSVDREVLAVRSAPGICDGTNLGKLDVPGTGAGAFLDRIYAGTVSTAPGGKVRHGPMRRDDGIVLDDGTAARMGGGHSVVTTTDADPLFRHP